LVQIALHHIIAAHQNFASHCRCHRPLTIIANDDFITNGHWQPVRNNPVSSADLALALTASSINRDTIDAMRNAVFSLCASPHWNVNKNG
jgi:hypothetical protein